MDLGENLTCVQKLISLPLKSSRRIAVFSVVVFAIALSSSTNSLKKCIYNKIKEIDLIILLLSSKHHFWIYSGNST